MPVRVGDVVTKVLENAEDQLDAIVARLDLPPLRVYTPQQARQVMFGEDVADDVAPTVAWLIRKAGRGDIDHTKLARSTYFSPRQIAKLILFGARGQYGRPTYRR